MSKLLTAIIALTSALVICLPATAAAAPCSDEAVPADNSELDQYFETIPSDCGDTPVGGGGGEAGAGGSGGGSASGAAAAGAALAPSAEAALDALGADGQAAAALAEQTTPSGSETTPSGSGGGDGDGGQGTGGSESNGGDAASTVFSTDVDAESSPDGFSIGSAIGGVLSAFGGSGSGLGVMAPISFALIAFAGAGLLLHRRSLARAEESELAPHGEPDDPRDDGPAGAPG